MCVWPAAWKLCGQLVKISLSKIVDKAALFVQVFGKSGFSTREMVVLIGAHTVRSC